MSSTGSQRRQPRQAQRQPWDAERVQRLRHHIGETQAAFAERVGTRQQTVSEWETAASRPRGISQRMLHMVAEASGYYTAATHQPPPPHDGADGMRGGPDAPEAARTDAADAADAADATDGTDGTP